MNQHTDGELACCREHFPGATTSVSKDWGLSMRQVAAMDKAQQADGIDRLACLDEQANKTLPKTRYVEVTARGELRVTAGTVKDRLKFAKQGIGGVWPESWTAFTNFPRRWPVRAYGWFPLGKEDFANGGRRLNTVANAMVWELTAPVDPDADRELEAEHGELPEPAAERAQTRFRGNVVFHAGAHVGLDDEQLAAVEDAHRAAVDKLRRKGWIK
ncbi:hypothetical protein ACQRET_03410 [Streptomyces koyangensis]|uniref:hypothetical protein n=1 Tax=Streptomyces koyangensis TaxID=188770 RepID=UPI003D03CCA5